MYGPADDKILPDQQSFQYSTQQPSQKSRSLMKSVNEENNIVSKAGITRPVDTLSDTLNFSLDASKK